jgi:Helicase HerA, central domain
MTLAVSDSLSLPLDLAGEAIAILGKRGSGKTNTATVFVEELVRSDVQTVILDPVGAWWGLRSNAAGNGPGLEIPRLGGQHGDVPLAETAGALVADVVLASHQSLLIDLSDFPTKAAVGRFVTDFAERLYRKKKADSVLHLVLEEADSFAPQRVKGSERMQGAIEQIVRRGRSRGMGVTLITQRSAVLSKDVLTQADVLIVMRTTGPHDLRAIREWIDSRGDEHGIGVLDSLPSLDTGEGWVWNPERELLERVQFRARETFDSSRTPKAGEFRVEPDAAAPIDIDALGEQIRATAEKAKADDPAELRKRIRELENVVATVEASHVVETVEVPVFNGEVEQLSEAVTGLLAASASISGAADDIVEALARWKGADHAATATAPRPAPRPEPPYRPSREQPRPAASEVYGAGTTGVPTRPQQKILDALAWFEAIGLGAPRRPPLAAVAGVSSKSSGFRANVSTLSGLGFIQYPEKSRVGLTELGRQQATPTDMPQTAEALQDAVCDMVSGPQAALLRVLIEAYPQAVDRETLASRAGVSPASSGFRANVSTLSGWEVLTYPQPGYVAADPMLFLQ